MGIRAPIDYGYTGGGGVRKLVISQNRPTGWIGFASKAQPATKGFFSLITTPAEKEARTDGLNDGIGAKYSERCLEIDIELDQEGEIGQGYRGDY